MSASNMVLVDGRKGFPTLRYESGGYKYLHSLYDPRQEARQLVETWTIPPDRKTILLIGLGLGYHVFECLRKYPFLDKVIVLECHPDVIRLAKQCFPQELQSDRIRIVSPLDCSTAGQLLSDFDIESVFLHPASLAIFPHEELRALLEEIQMLRTATEAQKERLLSNWAANVHALTSESTLTGKRDIHYGRSAILVAAGPSLDRAREFLVEQSREGSVLMVVSAALRKILDWGLMPNYVIHSDSSDKSTKYLQFVNVDLPAPELLVLSTAHPDAVAAYPGRVRWVLQEAFQQSLEYARGLHCDTFSTGGSVSTLALSVLYYFGCNPITFVGLDLAYVSNRTHASGIHEELTSVRGIRGITVPSVAGGTVRTTITWNAFRHWFEAFIEQHSDRQYYNASKGVAIQGTRRIALGT